MSTSISKKRKFVADGVFFAELNHFLQEELGEDACLFCTPLLCNGICQDC